MTGWFCGGSAFVVLVALGYLRVATRSNVYKQIFSEAHFIEFAGGVVQSKNAAIAIALTGRTDVHSPEDDPRVFLTSRDLVFLYTVQPVEGHFVHHFSVSVGGYTARAVGEMFILLSAKLIGVHHDRLTLRVGTSTVHHAEVELSEVENNLMRAQRVPEMSPAEVAALRKEWIALRSDVYWARGDDAQTAR